MADAAEQTTVQSHRLGESETLSASDVPMVPPPSPPHFRLPLARSATKAFYSFDSLLNGTFDTFSHVRPRPQL